MLEVKRFALAMPCGERRAAAVCKSTDRSRRHYKRCEIQCYGDAFASETHDEGYQEGLAVFITAKLRSARAPKSEPTRLWVASVGREKLTATKVFKRDAVDHS